VKNRPIAVRHDAHAKLAGFSDASYFFGDKNEVLLITIVVLIDVLMVALCLPNSCSAFCILPPGWCRSL
jgi:hypothetical protein